MPLARQPLTIELALLGLLRRAPGYGYELYQQVSDPNGLWAIWRMKQSTLYALLARLEGDGLLTSELQPQETRPTRKLFKLTRAGHNAFRQWVHAPVQHPREMRLEFLLKLYFARREGALVAEQLLEAQRAVCEARLADEQQRVQALDPTSDAWLVGEFRIEQLKALMAWLATCVTAISR